MKEFANPQAEDNLRDIEIQRCSIQTVEVVLAGHTHMKMLRSWSPVHWLSGTSESRPCIIGRFLLLLFDDCLGNFELD